MIFASGLGVPEAPAVLPDGSWLVAEMAPDRGSVTQISPDGQQKRMVARTGRPNGLTIDRQGQAWVAESLVPSLLRLTLDGHVEVHMTGAGGDPFLFPNDLCFGPDGALYMTDSGMYVGSFLRDGAIRADYARAAYDGRVYRIDLQRRTARRLDSGLRFANGIAFGPDDNLYVSETITGLVYRYEWLGDGVGPRETFANVLGPEAPVGLTGPDGIKFGADGNLYAAVFGQGAIAVLGPQGNVIERMQTAGRLPTNLAFGSRGEPRIYVTEDEFGAVEVLDVGTGGLPLHEG